MWSYYWQVKKGDLAPAVACHQNPSQYLVRSRMKRLKVSVHMTNLKTHLPALHTIKVRNTFALICHSNL